MRWTRRWRRVWRAWRGGRRRPAAVLLDRPMPPKPPPGRWPGWGRLIALYLTLGLLTGAAIAAVSAPGAVRYGWRRTSALVRRAAGEAVPTTRYFLQEGGLAREAVRTTLPARELPKAGDRRPLLDRVVEGVTGLDPAAPETFLRRTLPASRLEVVPEPEIELGPEAPGQGRAAPAPAVAQPTPVAPTAAPSGPAAPDAAGTGPVPLIERHAEEELRRFPWGKAPLIGVYHTHSSETYHGPSGHKKGRSYASDDFVWGGTTGMVAVGDELARILTEDYRIPVVHSRNIHDYPVYRDAYANSAGTLRQMLARYPSLRIVLDLHRDGLAEVDREFITTVMGGERLARISLIVGRGQPGQPNPHWEENLALAQRLHAKMEEMYPGLSRGITTRNWPYNQELSGKVLLLEVGDHYNTREEARRSAALLADALAGVLADLANGSRIGGSPAADSSNQGKESGPAPRI
ncbi:MAG: stage II sporulation protein P [Chitinophagales bacterium]